MNDHRCADDQTFAAWDAAFAEWRRTLHSQLRLEVLLRAAGEDALAESTLDTMAGITLKLIEAAVRAGVEMGWAYCPETRDLDLPGLN